ncbi:MAG: LysE family translocator [Desulfobacteraceae bacterium]|nr:LysE family translocator [Desulfobacteraceae bacterium]
MSFQVWITYFFTVFVLIAIPGPTILYVITQSAANGKKTVFPLLAGIIPGDIMIMTCSIMGLGAVIYASSAVFTVLKWAGALYLVFLGVKFFFEKPDSELFSDLNGPKSSNGKIIKRAFLVTALNPKGIAFFIAFFPQFISEEQSYFIQVFILCATFSAVSIFNVVMYSLFSGAVGDFLGSSGIRKVFNMAGGTALCGAGIFTAVMEK